jgi:hypothetical protein
MAMVPSEDVHLKRQNHLMLAHSSICTMKGEVPSSFLRVAFFWTMIQGQGKGNFPLRRKQHRLWITNAEMKLLGEKQEAAKRVRTDCSYVSTLWDAMQKQMQSHPHF